MEEAFAVGDNIDGVASPADDDVSAAGELVPAAAAASLFFFSSSFFFSFFFFFPLFFCGVLICFVSFSFLFLGGGDMRGDERRDEKG